jgi:glucose-6-phosphate 1-dehydrogenase
MMQNHLLQILCLMAMEPPVSFQADEIRNKKVDVLHAIRPIAPDAVHACASRGQYGAGWIQGQPVAAYRAEPGVSPASGTETFAAVKLFFLCLLQVAIQRVGTRRCLLVFFTRNDRL